MPSTIKRQLTKRAIRERDALFTGASLDLNLPTREILELSRKRGTGISSNLDTIPQSPTWKSAAYLLDTAAGGANGYTPSMELVVDASSADDCAQSARVEMLGNRKHLTHNNPDVLLRSVSQRRAKNLVRNSKNRTLKLWDILARASADRVPTGVSDRFLKTALSHFCLTLSPVDQLIFRMLYNGHTHQYCADKLGIARQNVSKRVAKFPRLLESWAANHNISTYELRTTLHA